MLGHGVGFCLDRDELEEVVVRRTRRLRWFVGRGNMVLFCVNRRYRCNYWSSLCCEDGLVVLVKLLREFPGFGRSTEPPISGPADKHQSCRSLATLVQITTYILL